MIYWSSWFRASTYTLNIATSIAFRSRIFLIWTALPCLNRIDSLLVNPTSSLWTWPQFQLPVNDLHWFDPLSKNLWPIQSRTGTPTHWSSAFCHHTSSLLVVAAWPPSLGWPPCSPPSLNKCGPCDCLIFPFQISAAGQRSAPRLRAPTFSSSFWESVCTRSLLRGHPLPEKNLQLPELSSSPPSGSPPST